MSAHTEAAEEALEKANRVTQSNTGIIKMNELVSLQPTVSVNPSLYCKFPFP
jgi:hypothetical protein